jgi:ABC-type sugar transport system permease subunit
MDQDKPCDDRAAWPFMAPFIAVYALLFIYPTWRMIASSFTDASLTLPGSGWARKTIGGWSAIRPSGALSSTRTTSPFSPSSRARFLGWSWRWRSIGSVASGRASSWRDPLAVANSPMMNVAVAMGANFTALGAGYLAASVLAGLPTAIVYLLFQRRVTQAVIMSAGVKG